MKTARHPVLLRRERLRRTIASLHRGNTRDLPLLDDLLGDAEVCATFTDAELKDTILVVKHHRPDLALNLLTRVRTPEERISLGNCLAAIWSRIDINAAWRAITASSLPEAERLSLYSAMV
ncbi:hypothetical protein [Prosthecobacter vanneervenii]|uniref:Uncharacterized protein n=1 Tax=Prosthecobacter vanneervenii TaxID=48466 RepID=A0A7W8DIJ7_9BACT|nr:hypothetical protein [Prosthecobacter vanneervenii]MBB5031025.1 hypothetical protein [Prosthecobacter vanneervenii]